MSVASSCSAQIEIWPELQATMPHGYQALQRA
jgi:hypothetical protein